VNKIYHLRYVAALRLRNLNVSSTTSTEVIQCTNDVKPFNLL